MPAAGLSLRTWARSEPDIHAFSSRRRTLVQLLRFSLIAASCAHDVFVYKRGFWYSRAYGLCPWREEIDTFPGFPLDNKMAGMSLTYVQLVLWVIKIFYISKESGF